MKLVEIIQLNKNKELSELCHQCKNLYNKGLWYIYNYYDIFDKYLNWYDTKWMLKKSEPFMKIPSQVAQNVLKYLHLSWKSYFSSKKDWEKNPKKYKRMPQSPKYLKKNGEYIACFNHQHIKIKDGKLYFPKKTKLEPIEVETKQEELQQVRIIPKNDIYNLELIYNKNEIYNINLDKDRMIGIDIGVNNLACIVNNVGIRPISINGRPLKSINQFYNKKIAEKQKEVSKRIFNECKKEFIGKIYKENDKLSDEFISYLENKSKYILKQTKYMKRFTRIRNNKIKDYMHKASRIIINYCIENNIGTIIIGKNKNWKQKVNLGKRINQNFVQIPFNMLIEKLQYKAELVGIDIVITTEEYTSKTCCKCGIIKKSNRKYRGLYICSKCGTKINADVNGAYNIMKKAFPKTVNVDGIEGTQLYPLLINLNTKSKLVSIKTS